MLLSPPGSRNGTSGSLRGRAFLRIRGSSCESERTPATNEPSRHERQENPSSDRLFRLCPGAFAHAAFLAERYDAELYVVHAVDWLAGDSVYSPLQQTLEAKALHERLRDIVQDMVADAVAGYEGGKLHTERVRVVSAPAPKILEYAKQRDIDLSVQASHGRTGLKRFLLGSVAEAVMRAAARPVFTVKSFGKSLVGEGDVQPEMPS